MGTGEFTARGNPAMDSHPISGGEKYSSVVASCYGNRDKLRPVGPLGSYTDLTLHYTAISRSVGKKYTSARDQTER